MQPLDSPCSFGLFVMVGTEPMKRRGFLALLPLVPAGFKAAVLAVMEAQVPVDKEKELRIAECGFQTPRSMTS